MNTSPHVRVALVVLCALAVCVRVDAKQPAPGTFVVIKYSNAAGSGEVLGVVGQFGNTFPHTEEGALTGVLASVAPENACNATTPLDSDKVALVTRGDCAFHEKQQHIDTSGGAAILITNDDTEHADTVFTMSGSGSGRNIPAALLSYNGGRKLREVMGEGETTVKMFTPVMTAFDGSGVLIFLMAVSTVVAATYWGASADRHLKSMAPRSDIQEDDAQRQRRRQQLERTEEETVYISWKGAVAFVILASCSLILMFFFISKIIFVLIVMFAIAGNNTMAFCATAAIREYGTCIPWKDKYLPGKLSEMPVVTACVLPFTVTLSVVWVVYRHENWAWVLQDFMAVPLCMVIVKTIRLPSLRTATLLLVLAFLYDIFWVFLSPMLFKKSVMITVARGGDTGEEIPMLMKVPHFEDYWEGYSLLGLGDIVLPSLLITYCLRFDVARGYALNRSYWALTCVGYFFGLIFTYVALVAMQSGQPALLYLVPCTVLPTAALGWIRGDLERLWNGQLDDESLMSKPVEQEMTAQPQNASNVNIPI
eukprot:GFYU01001272.1.p1 GENE.GFYU01001272.1~~GFYU01001272.1.p1  ORF type:complete len:537 (+),score=140.17 GFYU01001272.1:178-1788(+)